MLTEFDVLDHVVLDDKDHCMFMLIVDTEDIWRVSDTGGIFGIRQKRAERQRELEHLVCLKKKVENYIGYICDNGIIKSFPDCPDPERYSYDIHIITDFVPKPDYIGLIGKMNDHISKQRSDIRITNEVKMRTK